MKPSHRLTACLILFALAAGFAFAGCTAAQVEQAARDVHYVAGGEPAPAGEATTQPSAGHQAARAAVQVGSAVNPAVSQIAGIVALLSGAVAGAAGHFNGRRSGRRQAHTVIAEIVQDIKAFKDPDVPWTDATRRLLEDLGYTDAARPTLAWSILPSSPPAAS